jgi:hypothetical protein
MIVQQLIIFYFIYWTVEEYTNNAYFQSYVNAGIQDGGFTIIAVSSVLLFSAVATGMYMKLRQTHMELQRLAATETSVSDSKPPDIATTASSSILAPHQEQHLINMIRNSASADSTSAAIPVLKREEPSGRAK